MRLGHGHSIDTPKPFRSFTKDMINVSYQCDLLQKCLNNFEDISLNETLNLFLEISILSLPSTIVDLYVQSSRLTFSGTDTCNIYICSVSMIWLAPGSNYSVTVYKCSFFAFPCSSIPNNLFVSKLPRQFLDFVTK